MFFLLQPIQMVSYYCLSLTFLHEFLTDGHKYPRNGALKFISVIGPTLLVYEEYLLEFYPLIGFGSIKKSYC